MKTNLLFLFLFSLAAGNLYAQKFYVSTGGGYSFVDKNSRMAGIINDYYFGNVKGGYGQGVNIILTGGMMLNKQVSLELGCSYLSGEENKTTLYEPSIIYITWVTRGRILRIMPAIKIMGPKTFKPYFRAGMVIGAGTKIFVEEVGHDIVTHQPFPKRETTYYGGTAFGWVLSIGVEYKFKNISIFCEGNLINQKYYPAIEWRDYKPTKNLAGNDSKDYWFSFSSYGINAGVTFFFGGKKTKDVNPVPENK